MVETGPIKPMSAEVVEPTRRIPSTMRKIGITVEPITNHTVIVSSSGAYWAMLRQNGVKILNGVPDPVNTLPAGAR